ncbi:MAG: preprotein translocase subunit SecG, partial [Pseudomonadota bacterium]|nr:preprotein translocase subunit SecG [Pseudomonadota bacterium]
METLVLTIHILIALALIGAVLLQRSEGGGLGIGGGGGAGGGFMTARGTANLMTRVTAILAASFFATSLLLAIMAGAQRESVSIVDEV